MPLTITETEHRRADFDLATDELELLWRMEERHFWTRARNRWIEKALRAVAVTPPATVLEVGCGSGAVAAYLHGRGYRVTGVDTAAPLVEKAHQRCPDALFIAGDVARQSLGSFDCIGLFDVLEHLDDPLAMLDACRRHARPGTVFAATVPAQRALHSVIDDLSGHKKRFETGELAALLAAAGLGDIEERGIFRSTVPMQRALRRSAHQRSAAQLSDDERRALWVRNFQIPIAPVNFALGAICAIERAAGFGWARNRAGASLLATGRLPS
jgi:SAM-dependent methyltransferase